MSRDEGLVKEEEYKGYKIKVYMDTDAQNPRTEWELDYKLVLNFGNCDTHYFSNSTS